MPQLASHDENRKKVCVLCCSKIIFGKSKPAEFTLTEKLRHLIRKYSSSEFNEYDSRYPSSICGTCRLTLLDREKNIFRRPLPLMPEYNTLLSLPKVTRSTKSPCNCLICNTARFRGHKKVLKGRGNIRGKKFILNSNLNRKQVMCKSCLQETGRGIGHKCSVTHAAKNLEKIVKKLPVKQREQVIVSSLKSRIPIKQGSSLSSGRTTYNNIEVKLSTRGPSARVILNPQIKAEVFFPEERLDNYQLNTGASSNQMETLTNFIRCCAGRKAVPSFYRQHVTEKSKLLAAFYKENMFEFDVGGERKEMRSVIWADAEELVKAVIDERKEIGKPEIKVMADGGQGFFKICLTIFPEHYLPELDRGTEQIEEIEEQEVLDTFQTKRKRSLYSEGGRSASRGKLSGVHRLIILCIVPQVKETYENIKLLFDLTQINKISFKFVSDLKLTHIINGMQTSTASYPCPYCYVPLKSLRSNHVVSGSDNNEEKDLRTYGDIRKNYWKFSSCAENKKFARECFSIINLPLFEEDDDVKIVQKCIIPELHILQGFVNHVFWKGLVPLVGREKALNWPKQLGLIAKNYQGEIFEGNACRKLLKESDRLLNVDVCGDNALQVVPIITTLKAMNKIVDDCFSTKKVSETLKEDVEQLKKTFSATGISETLKIHIVMNHLEDCVCYLNRGLGLWSEQPGESVHREFLKYWNKYKINNISDSRYGSFLLKAVVEFASKHL